MTTFLSFLALRTIISDLSLAPTHPTEIFKTGLEHTLLFVNIMYFYAGKRVIKIISRYLFIY
jgi:hypothetical protein